MQVVKFVALIAFVLLCIFVAVNWSALTAPTTLSIVFGQIAAPLGLIMLVVMIAVVVLFLVYAASVRTSMLLESRRYAQQLQAQRELADQAEASRFTELRGYLEGELKGVKSLVEDAAVKIVARCDGLEQSMTHAFTETTNTLSAYIGEVEDKLERLLPPSPR